MNYYPILWKHCTSAPTPYAPGEKWFYRIDYGGFDAGACDGPIHLGVHLVACDSRAEGARVDVGRHFQVECRVDDQRLLRQIELTFSDHITVMPQIEGTMLEISLIASFNDKDKRFKTEDNFTSANLYLENQTMILIHKNPGDKLNIETVHVDRGVWVRYNGEDSEQIFNAKKDATLPDRNAKVDKLLGVFGFLENDKRDLARAAGVKPPKIEMKKPTNPFMSPDKLKEMLREHFKVDNTTSGSYFGDETSA